MFQVHVIEDIPEGFFHHCIFMENGRKISIRPSSLEPKYYKAISSTQFEAWNAKRRYVKSSVRWSLESNQQAVEWMEHGGELSYLIVATGMRPSRDNLYLKPKSTSTPSSRVDQPVQYHLKQELFIYLVYDFWVFGFWVCGLHVSPLLGSLGVPSGILASIVVEAARHGDIRGKKITSSMGVSQFNQ